MFVQPTWFEGLIFYVLWIGVPLLIGLGIGALGMWRENGVLCAIGIVGIVIGIIMALGGAYTIWHFEYEVPSIQEEIITVEDWQPVFGHYWGDVKSADDLMLKTSDGRLFENTEKLLFGKFDTRDTFDKLRPNGTYKIKYYGWREGFNNGVPNILSVEEVVNETNCTGKHDISNYMNKRSIIYDDDNN